MDHSKTRQTAALGAALNHLRPFLSRAQYLTLWQATRGEEGDWFKARTLEWALRVHDMPRTYAQDGLGDEAVAHLHYFIGGADWYITERDSDPDGAGQTQAFGLADLGMSFPELGYISIAEITAAGAELDLHWTPRTLAEVNAKAHAG